MTAMSKEAEEANAPAEDVDYSALDRIIDEEFDDDPENLIMILQAIQRLYNYLPKAALEYLSIKIGLPLSRIYGVATFYSTFSLKPRGRHVVSICRGTACHVRGSNHVHEKARQLLGVEDGQTTPDGRFTLETVYCVGGCSLGPMVKINEEMRGRVTEDQIENILDKFK
jgi:NADH:ubiquinone oxidoreductase subunit E